MINAFFRVVHIFKSCDRCSIRIAWGSWDQPNQAYSNFCWAKNGMLVGQGEYIQSGRISLVHDGAAAVT